MLPQFYHINGKSSRDDSVEEIYRRNKESNDQVLQLRESGQFNYARDFSEIHHHLHEIKDFIDVADANATFSILDMPGLNCGGDDLYYQYIRDNSHKVDIYVLVFDINSGMNANDEVKILQLVAEQVKKNGFGFVHILVNKCDEINFDENKNLTDFDDEEISELYRTCQETAKKHMPGVEVPTSAQCCAQPH